MFRFGSRAIVGAVFKRRVSPTLVGRLSERSVLQSAWTAAKASAGVVLIAGESGMGKTRLVRDRVGVLAGGNG